ncbi:hypothetical protein SASPL_121493 [Salvia splendens]|uniref:WD repeat-containing protein 53 n=1 Tax=Salvia splendens TaxID=180675 RepID=A0A8X8ZW52_SALSN|nr:hypothetical protein SASPL_121493 [Salvia splendens]
MEAENVLNLFDSMWFHLGILEKTPTPPLLQTQPSQPSNQNVSRQLSLLGRSKSDDLSSFTTKNSTSPAIKPHLQTILSDKEVSVSLEIPKSPVMKKAVIKQQHDMRRKKKLSKSMSQLEFEEVKGFIDMGFVFSEEAKDDRALVEIVPGLQKLGQRTECGVPETEEKRRRRRRRSEEVSRMRGRPYLSEAWEFYEEEEKRARIPQRAADMTEPRRLRGHSAAATCCIASRARPGFIATAAEDGRVCFYDLRCKDMLFSMDVENGNPVSSLCFKPGNEEIIYVSVENEIKCFDLHMVCFDFVTFLSSNAITNSLVQCVRHSWKQLEESYNYNKDEINQIACHPKSSFLAAADDAGDVKICSSVQFLPWRSWEVITGGLDSKLALWDFSKGRPNKIMDFGSGGNAGQCYNPAFVHALVVPDLDFVDSVGKICVVARGDGVVNVINLEPEHAAQKSKNTSKPKMGTKSQLKEDSPTVDQNDRNLHLDYSKGGHVAAVSCVSFSTFGEKGKLIISGGNDKSVKVWDWMKSHDGGGQTSNGSSDIVCSSITLSRKVNWLCTTPSDSENLVVCDTSKLVKVYTIG